MALYVTLLLTFFRPAPASDGAVEAEKGHIPGGEADGVDEASVLLQVQGLPQADQGDVVVPRLGVEVLPAAQKKGNNYNLKNNINSNNIIAVIIIRITIKDRCYGDLLTTLTTHRPLLPPFFISTTNRTQPTLCVIILATGYSLVVSAERLTSPTLTVQKGGGRANLKMGLWVWRGGDEMKLEG